MSVLAQDLIRAKQQADCFQYCMKTARIHFENSEFDKAIAFLKNAIRSLEELETIKQESSAINQATAMLLDVDCPIEVLNQLVQKINKKALSSREANLASK